MAPTSLATDKERLQDVLYISEVDGTPKSLIYQSRAKKCQMTHEKKKSGNRIALKMLLYLGLCSECQILDLYFEKPGFHSMLVGGGRTLEK